MASQKENPDFATNWKGRDQNWYQVDAAKLLALGVGIATFTKACFDVEMTVAAAIDEDEITTVEEIDAADWPSNDDPWVSPT